MSEMIERVAAAIAALDLELPGDLGIVQLAPAAAKRLAVAAICAMRHPTAPMIKAATDDEGAQALAQSDIFEFRHDNVDLISTYSAMIDAAVAGNPLDADSL